jgi:hypothetical protein
VQRTSDNLKLARFEAMLAAETLRDDEAAVFLRLGKFREGQDGLGSFAKGRMAAMMSDPSSVTHTKGEVSLLGGRTAARTASTASRRVGAFSEVEKSAAASSRWLPLRLASSQTPWT